LPKDESPFLRWGRPECHQFAAAFRFVYRLPQAWLRACTAWAELCNEADDGTEKDMQSIFGSNRPLQVLPISTEGMHKRSILG